MSNRVAIRPRRNFSISLRLYASCMTTTTNPRQPGCATAVQVLLPLCTLWPATFRSQVEVLAVVLYPGAEALLQLLGRQADSKVTKVPRLLHNLKSGTENAPGWLAGVLCMYDYYSDCICLSQIVCAGKY